MGAPIALPVASRPAATGWQRYLERIQDASGEVPVPSDESENGFVNARGGGVDFDVRGGAKAIGLLESKIVEGCQSKRSSCREDIWT